MGIGYCSSCGTTTTDPDRDSGCWYCVPPKAIWSRVKCPDCQAIPGLACEDADGIRQPDRRQHRSRVDLYWDSGAYGRPAPLPELPLDNSYTRAVARLT